MGGRGRRRGARRRASMAIGLVRKSSIPASPARRRLSGMASAESAIDRRTRAALRRFALPERAGGRVAVEHRHLDVHQHEVVAAHGQRRQRLGAAADEVVGDAELAQEQRDHELVGRVVLDDQTVQRRGGGRRRRAGRRAGPRGARGGRGPVPPRVWSCRACALLAAIPPACVAR